MQSSMMRCSLKVSDRLPPRTSPCSSWDATCIDSPVNLKSTSLRAFDLGSSRVDGWSTKRNEPRSRSARFTVLTNLI